MSTIRVASRTRFTVVDRQTVNDLRLSFRARGVLVWLLDKPDDWETNVESIAKATTEGRDAIRTAIRELESAKYIKRSKWRDSKTGQWESEFLVYERPYDEIAGRDHNGKPALENQRRVTSDGKPATVFQASKEKTDSITDTETETEDSLSDISDADAETDDGKFPLSEQHYRLANLLADEIEFNGNKRPVVGKAWARTVDLMIRRDDRTPERIEACIRWCQQDEFWRRNILSMDSLRKHYDRLRMDAKDRTRKKRQGNISDDGTRTKSHENIENYAKRSGITA